MPIKKSIIWLLAFTAGSFSLLVFSFRTDAVDNAHQKCNPVNKCCQQNKDVKPLSPRNTLIESMFHLSA